MLINADVTMEAFANDGSKVGETVQLTDNGILGKYKVLIVKFSYFRTIFMH